MNRYVAFLRAINVGGHVVRMDELRRLFETIGFDNVTTFIASGNVLFDAPGKNTPALEKTIAGHLHKALGYEVATFVRSPSEVAAIAEYVPFEAPELKEGSLLVGLLPEVVTAADKKKIATLESPVDSLRVHGREVYWHARQNFAKAQFQPARMEKLLDRPVTFRNITTLKKIAALLVKA